ncbi:unnamed protein product [Arctogadus glacialis]
MTLYHACSVVLTTDSRLTDAGAIEQRFYEWLNTIKGDRPRRRSWPHHHVINNAGDGFQPHLGIPCTLHGIPLSFNPHRPSPFTGLSVKV